MENFLPNQTKDVIKDTGIRHDGRNLIQVKSELHTSRLMLK